ncbi:MAG: RagB/SusD family nutrient uptake outer membrane protein [Filimonas sp.]|nr:RagB/SusD family nutrient uptake outer membrane protein [Filimonas sp.]
MKLKYILSLAVVASTVATGCKKDFLEKKPTQLISGDQLIDASKQDPSLLNGNIAGLYTTMFTPAVGGTTGHDDFGQKGIDIYTDMLCSDMVLGALNYGWYSNLVRYQATIDFTRNENYVPWRYYYRQIFGANTIIDALGGTTVTPPTATAKYIMGQAKAMRAYAYFYLTQLYGGDYGDGSTKILPIYKDTKVPNQPKSTAKAVFDLMISDLNDAITLLDGFDRLGSKDKVNKDVAKGLLAYVLATRGTQADWTQVLSITQDIMSAYPKTTKGATVAVMNGTVVTNPESGFNNVATPSWMWGVDLTIASGIDLISWWGQVDYYTYSYAYAGDRKLIDKGLYDAIRADDIRKKQFSSTAFMPLYKFFDPGRVPGGQRQVITDLVYMRSDEFYLLNAEANARLGQDGAARTTLTSFLGNGDRIADVSYINALAGQALLNEIYFQTRVEFWGEGKSYLAMKRNKATITRGSNHLFFAGQSFPYNDPKLTFSIPQAEVNNNPVLNN